LSAKDKSSHGLGLTKTKGQEKRRRGTKKRGSVANKKNQ